jgi:hypothetical protein
MPAASQEKLIPVEYTNAIITMAPISSITARAKRNVRSEATTEGPIMVNNPTAKAISVATGTPQPPGATSPAIS